MFLKTGKDIFGLVEYEYEGVRFLVKKGSSNRAFIFFSAFTKKGHPQSYNYVKTSIDNQEDSFLFFLDTISPTEDPRGTYFLGDSNGSYLQSILTVIKSEFEKLSDIDFWFMGSSKGGSGALLTCLELGIGTVLINAPQIRIGDYLSTRNPSAINEMGLSVSKLDNILLDKVRDVKSPIEIYISCGVEDYLHWYSHLNYFIKESSKNHNINLQVVPVRGGHDGVSLKDYGHLIASIIDSNKFMSDLESLKLNIGYFRNKTKVFYRELIYPNLQNTKTENYSLSSLKDNLYKHLSGNVSLTILNHQTAQVNIKGFEGIPLTVYAKDENNRILAKGGSYISYNHRFKLENMNTSKIYLLTVFMMLDGEKVTFTVITNLTDKLNLLDTYENEVSYLKYLSSEYSKVAQTVIRKYDDLSFQGSHIAPSFIDSSDTKLIARNGIGYSFRTCITNAVLRNYLPQNTRILNAFSKKATADFLSSRGYKVPEIYEYGVDVQEVLKYESCVIKPISGAGSKGVFIKTAKGYLDLRDKELITDYERFREKYSSYSKFKVLIEELVSNNNGRARDIKVFCFYGRSPLALEVIRSENRNYYCYYNQDMEIINSGQYSSSELFEGNGFNKELFPIAQEVSSLIPLPFIRVDFLVLDDEYRLGELTPIPGLYSRFNDEYDIKLGKEYLLAENRLKNDLLQGKQFFLT